MDSQAIIVTSNFAGVVAQTSVSSKRKATISTRRIANGILRTRMVYLDMVEDGSLSLDNLMSPKSRRRRRNWVI